MSTALLLMIIALATLAYVSVGYPAALRLLVAVRGPRPIRREPITPSVSLVISAYNEVSVIGAKIENALALDYPRELLEIVVISDASTDGTDAVVASYANQGVRLFRQETRLGKTAGLNAGLPKLSGQIVVFSDANAIYEPGALRALVRNFADPAVGCVTGEARYSTGGMAAADVGERLYWNYEMHIKRLETALGSMVGADGAIYAIRRELWQPLPLDAINDFLNPLQIVARGWRAVYEPEAVCYEAPGGSVRSEYRRRVRIVSRSWRAVFLAGEVLNPFRVGLFAWSVISHKILRWLAGLFASAGLAAAVWLLAGTLPRVSPSVIGMWVGILFVVGLAWPRARRAFGMAGYFAVINVASIVGIIKGSLGRVSGVWSTPRALASDQTGDELVGWPVGPVLLLTGAAILGLGLVAWRAAGLQHGAALVFWVSAGVLVYVFVGYPLLLLVMRTGGRKPIAKGAVGKSVCLFITANDEAPVIEAKLQNALATDYPADRLDIIVASDGSLDGTNEIVRRFAPRVRLLEFTPRRGKIAAINEGMQSVTSEIVVFSDANTFCEPQAVREIVANFADRSVGAVSGDVVLTGERASLGQSEDLYYRYERWAQLAESEVGSMIGVDGALYAIRRELFVPPAPDTILDDMAIPMAVIRAGRRVVFEPLALAHERGSETAREEFSRKARVVAGAMQFLARRDSTVPLARPQVAFSLISHKGLRWLTPLFAFGAFATSIALAGSTVAWAAAAAAQATFLLIGLAGCSPVFRRLAFVAVPHYFFLVQAAAAVGLLRGLGRRQSVLWRRFDRVSVP